jgi:uncharacterized protein (DUF1015 family)
MMKITPIDAYIVHPDFAERVVGPAYDVLSPDERRNLADGNPLSFLNVTRSAGDLPPDDTQDPARVQQESAARLRRMIEDGVFEPSGRPAFYVYRLSTREHAQTGVVADVPVSEYERRRVKPHEHTNPEKVDELVHFLQVVRANSSPVCLTYRPTSAIDDCVARICEAEAPILSFQTSEGVRQTLWRVDDAATQRRLTDAFAEIDTAYITDGHHRVEAAASFARARRTQQPESGSFDHFLTVFFPADQLRILPYNRCVTVERSQEAVLDVVAASLEVTPVPPQAQIVPERPGQFAMCLGGRWYRLERPSTVPTAPGSVEALDVSVLHRQVLGPLLRVQNPDYDPRVTYVAGARGLDALESCSQREGRVAFVVHPTSVEEVMAVCDAHEVMPPKSTWFDPKVRSGIFVVFR